MRQEVSYRRDWKISVEAQLPLHLQHGNLKVRPPMKEDVDGSALGPALIVDEGQPFVGSVQLMPQSNCVVELLYGVLPDVRG